MADYIEREAAMIAVEAVMPDGDVYEAFMSVPAADVRPVARGRWLKRDDMPNMDECKCSICGFADYISRGDAYWFLRNYCPICGADMRSDPSGQAGENTEKEDTKP